VLWLGLLGWSDCGTRLLDAFDPDQTLLATTLAALGGDGTPRRVRPPPWQVAGLCRTTGRAYGVVRHDLELGQAAPSSFPSMWSVSSVRAGSKDREPRKRGGYHARWNASRQWRQVLP
jgi:hypothetical protein